MKFNPSELNIDQLEALNKRLKQHGFTDTIVNDEGHRWDPIQSLLDFGVVRNPKTHFTIWYMGDSQYPIDSFGVTVVFTPDLVWHLLSQLTSAFWNHWGLSQDGVRNVLEQPGPVKFCDLLYYLTQWLGVPTLADDEDDVTVEFANRKGRITWKDLMEMFPEKEPVPDEPYIAIGDKVLWKQSLPHRSLVVSWDKYYADAFGLGIGAIPPSGLYWKSYGPMRTGEIARFHPVDDPVGKEQKHPPSWYNREYLTMKELKSGDWLVSLRKYKPMITIPDKNSDAVRMSLARLAGLEPLPLPKPPVTKGQEDDVFFQILQVVWDSGLIYDFEDARFKEYNKMMQAGFLRPYPWMTSGIFIWKEKGDGDEPPPAMFVSAPPPTVPPPMQMGPPPMAASAEILGEILEPPSMEELEEEEEEKEEPPKMKEEGEKQKERKKKVFEPPRMDEYEPPKEKDKEEPPPPPPPKPKKKRKKKEKKKAVVEMFA